MSVFLYHGWPSEQSTVKSKPARAIRPKADVNSYTLLPETIQLIISN